MKRAKEPEPSPPPAPPEKGKMSAAILEELKQVRKGNDEILAELRKPASRARRRNMYGEEEE